LPVGIRPVDVGGVIVLLATSLTANPTIWVNVFVGMCLCYSRARLFKLKTQHDPWGMPVWLWVVVGFVLGLLGAILAFIATRKSAIAAARNRRRYP